MKRLTRGIIHLALAAVLLWEVLALSQLPILRAELRWVLALVVAGFGIWALWITRSRWPKAVAVVLFIVCGFVWASVRPSLDRPWRPEVAVLPRVQIEGDRITVSGVRDFDYRSPDDFTKRYITRQLLLSQLESVDFFISYWKMGPVAHTFLSFNFRNEAPLSVSIETRPQIGQGYDPLASLFRHFELIYVVGQERDLVRVRTNFRGEEVFLYRTTMSPAAARRLFEVYAERINELAATPEFYHLLSNSCTINIVRYANRIGRVGSLDFRLILNGWSDRYLYRTGGIDTSMPFETLRARSNINAAAQAADQAEDFSKRIRSGLPDPLRTASP